MAITTAVCNSFKQELLQAEHNFSSLSPVTGEHDFYWALFTSSATLSAATTAYPPASPSNEVTGTGYTIGGATNVNGGTALNGAIATVDWADVTWSTATITARGVLLYNNSHASKASVAVWDFSSDKTSSGGDFTIQLPTRGASPETAILQLA